MRSQPRTVAFSSGTSLESGLARPSFAACCWANRRLPAAQSDQWRICLGTGARSGAVTSSGPAPAAAPAALAAPQRSGRTTARFGPASGATCSTTSTSCSAATCACEASCRASSIAPRVHRSAQDAVIMLDSDGNLEWWNPAANRLLGLKKPQDAGHPIGNLVRHPAFKEYFDSGNYDQPLELGLAGGRSHPPAVQHHPLWQSRAPAAGPRCHPLHQLEQMRKDFVANVSMNCAHRSPSSRVIWKPAGACRGVNRAGSARYSR